MPPKFDSPDAVIRAGFEQFKEFVPAEVRSAAQKKADEIQSYDGLVAALKTEGKLEDDLAHTVATSTVYGLLEKFGIDPAQWKFTVAPIEAGKIRYDTADFEQARRFLGTWTALATLALIVGSLAAAVTAVGAGILAAITMRAVAIALRSGAGIKVITNIFQLAKFRGIKWLSLPAFVAALGGAVTWFSSSQITATGDLTTYLTQGVRRGEETLQNLELRAAGIDPRTGRPFQEQPKIIIRMAETSKPQLFTGILFAAPLSKPEAFSRHLDDEITDLGDLQNDLKLNLANWVKGLAGRVSVAIAVRNNPIISSSEKLSGTWIVASLSYNLVDGGRVFLDSLPLGPINPIKYMPKVSEVKTLENQIFAEFKPESIKELIIPPSALTALTKEGELVPILPVAAAAAFRAPTAPAPEPIKTQEFFRAAGLAVPPGTPSAAAVAATSTPATFARSIGVPESRINQATGEIINPTPEEIAAFNRAFTTTAKDPLAGERIPGPLDVWERSQVNTPGSILNFRAGPSRSSADLGDIPHLTRVIGKRYAGLADGFNWYDIEWLGRRGFVAGEFLKKYTG